LGWGACMDVGVGMNCRCGNPALEGDHLCGKCRYFQEAFKVKVPEFESKRERALRSIYIKRATKNISTVTVGNEQ